MATRNCRRCKKKFELNIENFWPTKSGFQYYCKDCHRIKGTEWRKEKMKDPQWAKKEREYRKTYQLKHKGIRRKRAVERVQRYRNKVFEYYGKTCSWCGESDYSVLTIDHTNNDGKEHRKEIGRGKAIYSWLIKNNFPEGFQPLCWNCNMSKYFNGGELPENRKDINRRI